MRTVTVEEIQASIDRVQGMTLGEKSMQHKICKILSAGTEFEHKYDYGSTAYLKLRVAGVREANIKKPDTTLLARNQPPPWKCARFGKPATQIETNGRAWSWSRFLRRLC